MPMDFVVADADEDADGSGAISVDNLRCTFANAGTLASISIAVDYDFDEISTDTTLLVLMVQTTERESRCPSNRCRCRAMRRRARGAYGNGAGNCGRRDNNGGAFFRNRYKDNNETQKPRASGGHRDEFGSAFDLVLEFGVAGFFIKHEPALTLYVFACERDDEKL